MLIDSKPNRPASTEPSPYTDDTEVFLLMSKKSPQARGFLDIGTGRAFTFAFTSEEKAKRFLKHARKRSLLTDVNLLYKLTIGEFFQWKETGRTNSELTIDPDPSVLAHRVFKGAAYNNN